MSYLDNYQWKDLIDCSYVSDDGNFLKNVALRGKVFRLIACIVLFYYTLVTFTLDLSAGFYGLKIPIIAISILLLFSPVNYPFLLGYIIMVHYVFFIDNLETSQTTYTIRFNTAILLAMFLFKWFYVKSNQYQLPHQRFSISSLCFLLLIFISIGGYVAIENKYLYVRRLLELIAFAGAFYLGKSSIDPKVDMKLLLLGNFWGLLAFQLPITLGFILRSGVGVLRNLYRVRSEMVTSSTDSGIVMIILILSYLIFVNSKEKSTKLFVFFLLFVPSVIVIMLYLSRAAIVLAFLAVFIGTFFSVYKKTAFVMTLGLIMIGGVVVLKSNVVQDLIFSFGERMAYWNQGYDLRGDIRIQAINMGLSNPIFGVGPGQYEIHSGYFVTAHNELLNFWAEHGAMGFFVCLVLWGSLFYAAFKTMKSNVLYYKIIGMIFIILLPIQFIYVQRGPVYFKGAGFLFAYLSGFLINIYQLNKNTNEYDMSNY